VPLNLTYIYIVYNIVSLNIAFIYIVIEPEDNGHYDTYDKNDDETKPQICLKPDNDIFKQELYWNKKK